MWADQRRDRAGARLQLAEDERLALLYVFAGRRAGSWMVPGFHAALDEGISDEYDDRQNFDLTTFALRFSIL